MSAISEIGDQQSVARVQSTASQRGRRTEDGERIPSALGLQSSVVRNALLRVALLTGGDDRPYVLGLVGAFTLAGVSFDVIGSDDLNLPDLRNNPLVNFLNLRGNQNPNLPFLQKASRVLIYYWRLLRYAAVARPQIFHILWHNKFEFFDRTLLILYYKLLGKKVLFTAHNVNARKRDGNDSYLNRLSLRAQYQLVDHIFVHTHKMKAELVTDFRIREDKISVIPFGINNTVPTTALDRTAARRALGISDDEKTLLCYGQIAPYKGLEYLVQAFVDLLKSNRRYRLIIAGKPKWNEVYWNKIAGLIRELAITDRVICRIEHVPDDETELYFKAADVLVLPYTRVFQSGVIFLGYSFGLPAVVTDVGSLKEEIIEGETGLVCRPDDPLDLARAIMEYFGSELFHSLERRRSDIKAYANDKYSWDTVAAITMAVYSRLLTSNI